MKRTFAKPIPVKCSNTHCNLECGLQLWPGEYEDIWSCSQPSHIGENGFSCTEKSIYACRNFLVCKNGMCISCFNNMRLGKGEGNTNPDIFSSHDGCTQFLDLMGYFSYVSQYIPKILRRSVIESLVDSAFQSFVNQHENSEDCGWEILFGDGFEQIFNASNPHFNNFFRKVSNFMICRKSLNELWRSSERVDKVLPIDLVESGDGTFNPEARQMSVTGSTVNTMSELFSAAGLASHEFEKLLISAVEACGISRAQLQIAPLKSMARAAEKASADYSSREQGPGYAWLFDIVRGSILCETETEIAVIAEYFLEQQKNEDAVVYFEVIRLKNRFCHPTPGGFRDINLNIRLRIKTNTVRADDTVLQVSGASSESANDFFFHTCELQIHHQLIKVKDKELGSHKNYSYFRTFFKGNTASVSKRIELLETFFPLHAEGVTGDLDATIASVVSTEDIEVMEKFSFLLTALMGKTHHSPLCAYFNSHLQNNFRRL